MTEVATQGFIINEFYDPVLFPKYTRKYNLHLAKLSEGQRDLQRKIHKLSKAAQLRYVHEVIQIEKMSRRSREMMEKGTKTSYTNGPATIDVYTYEGKTLVSGDCPECKAFPCKHSGTDFTKTGALSGIFPK